MLQHILHLSKRFFFILVILLVITFVLVTSVVYIYPQTAISFIQKHFVPTPTIVQKEIIGMGILGDSQSDEYRADDNRGDNYPSVTYNWVEILSQHRHLNFGTWGTRAEPRRTG